MVDDMTVGVTRHPLGYNECFEHTETGTRPLDVVGTVADSPARSSALTDVRRRRHNAIKRVRVDRKRTVANRVPGRTTAKRTPKSRSKKWSAAVMQRSDAMDLEAGIFKKSSARQIARSLKRSVERSTRRKSPPFRSAMSMLNFEINRAGKNLSAHRRSLLNQAKIELRKLFHREPAKKRCRL